MQGYPQPADSLPDTRPSTCWPRPLLLFLPSLSFSVLILLRKRLQRDKFKFLSSGVYCTIPELAYSTEKKSKKKNCQAVVVAAEKTKKKKFKNVNDIRRGVNDLANCLRASLSSLHQLHDSLVSALRQSSAYLITVSERRFLHSGNQSHLLLGHRGWMVGFLIHITTILELR